MTAPSDNELRDYETGESDPRFAQVRAMARELLAARPVVRAAKRWVAAKTDAPEDFDALTDSLAAYDKARKGGG